MNLKANSLNILEYSFQTILQESRNKIYVKSATIIYYCMNKLTQVRSNMFGHNCFGSDLKTEFFIKNMEAYYGAL